MQAELFSTNDVAPWLHEPPTYIASGSNHEGEVRGFAAQGVSVGVSADRVTAGAERALGELRGSALVVFVDSGAFGEMSFDDGLPSVRRPISDESWRRRLGTAERLARALGSQALIVAPDRVGCQATTLERLRRYADVVTRIAGSGARILVPVQGGSLSGVDFFAACAALLPGIELVPAIPCKKAATSPAALRSFVRQVRPRAIHLLGVGPRSGRFRPLTAAVAEAVPSCRVTCDSVAIKSAVGRGAGPKESVRPLTAAQDAVANEIAEDRWGEHVGDDGILDYTEAIGDPSSWVSPSAAKRLACLAVRLRLAVDAADLTKDLTAWLREDDTRGEVLSFALDEEWSRHHFRRTVVERKRRAISEWTTARSI